jgi:iron complex outermembrane receptor protein
MKSLFTTAGLATTSLSNACAQQSGLRGTILNAQTQQALPGATVVVPGTSWGTTTDVAGRFELPAAAGTWEVTVSFSGYNTQKVRVPAEGQKYCFLAWLRSGPAGFSVAGAAPNRGF